VHQPNADLTLLSQSLNKSKRITDKMTSMLSDFDDRLAKLEKSLVPIYKQTGRLTRVSKSERASLGRQVGMRADGALDADLEATLRSIDGLLGHHDLVERESLLIAKG
jgi:exocyst complex protein 7